MASDTKTLLLQHLEEAHATEQALDHQPARPHRDDPARLLPHVAGAPPDRDPAATSRPSRAGSARSGATAASSTAAYGAVTTAVGQALVLTKGPLDLLRGGPRGEEKLLKNARDEVVTEALEIAIYDVIEALAKAVGDDADRAARRRHRADEEQMLGRAARAHPAARRGGRGGAAPAARRATTGRATGAAETVKRKAKTTRRPRVTKTQAPTSDYDKLTASEVVGKLTDFTQAQLSRRRSPTSAPTASARR